MTGLPILEILIREAISRTGGTKPIFAVWTFSKAMQEEFELLDQPSETAAAAVLKQLPYLRDLGKGFWAVTWESKRVSMLGRELLD